MSVLLGVGTDQLSGSLISLFGSTLSAVSFLLFTLLYTPCIAAAAAIKRELDSTVKTAGIIALQCVIAWIVSVCVYQTGMLL